MKIIACALVLGLALLSLPTTPAAGAQVAPQSASGNFRFALSDGLSKSIEFSASTDSRGTTSGGMTLSGQMYGSDPSSEGGDPRTGTTPTDFYIKATFDCLTASRNRAVMGGTVTDSNPKSYTGQRVLLVVEDNYPANTNHDLLSWRIYNATAGGWVPKDAERPDDNGASLKWTATDAERKDDAGIPMPPGSQVVRCQDFLLSSHVFVYTRYMGGDISVKQ
ncbi:MAG TPA: hypothetical protein VER32_12565 [Pyrinomonadaceae bacterium]|nr:hypothetical protein [Pyrinomonadaceae bacterium]